MSNLDVLLLYTLRIYEYLVDTHIPHLSSKDLAECSCIGYPAILSYVYSIHTHTHTNIGGALIFFVLNNIVILHIIQHKYIYLYTFYSIYLLLPAFSIYCLLHCSLFQLLRYGYWLCSRKLQVYNIVNAIVIVNLYSYCRDRVDVEQFSSVLHLNPLIMFHG